MEEKIVFKGKISIWFYIFVVGFNLIPIMYLTKPLDWTIMLSFLLFLTADIFILPLIFVNRVELFDHYFMFYFGFAKKHIDLKDIKQMYKSRDLTSSTACSLDRIYIDTLESDFMISLEDNDYFMEIVKERNPAIK